MFFKFISIIAAILTTVSFVPQAVKTIKTKDTAGISFVMYLLFTIGVFCWLIYGAYIKDIAIISANAVTLILASIILKYKFDNVRKFNES
ncbi:SemiSWEET transporter [Clostridium fungisolvens]|uniref:Sugar transporter SemiSWEET n=1 Tax=Clostridium fungisolvens TaxID=1604897 RepID=A0A6V8SDE3_9CLOT|nr:SemiSWEET transporter [Clostridium fungisolvens]GFP74572.1 Sugar transporter SemiSWEET [Clostridium fungisolvens]